MRARRRQFLLRAAAGLALTAVASAAAAQAVAIKDTDVSVAHPAYRPGAGPVVALDEGHNDYHTLSGRYAPFGAVLANDGFRVAPFQGRFVPAALARVGVLVVANPLARSNVDNWTLPTPSAFDPAEIEAVKAWVRKGGALFLIADHMPFAGAVTDLAAAFGFQFDNAYRQGRWQAAGDVQPRGGQPGRQRHHPGRRSCPAGHRGADLHRLVVPRAGRGDAADEPG